LREKADKLLSNLEERMKFFSQLGVEYLSSPVSSSASSPVSKSSSFVLLIESVLCCQKCLLSQERKNAVPGEGNSEAELMFVGEAPGHDEDVQGKPFVGRAGQLLTKIINAMGYQRQGIYITNVIKCRPPQNRTPYKKEIEQCGPYLLEQIEMIGPKVIVALGKVAADFFIESDLSMSLLRGNFYEFKKIRVMPTFHPSYIIRNEGNREIKKMVWEDMKKVMAVLGKK
jgi:uracil-DNA glycosylase family 4